MCIICSIYGIIAIDKAVLGIVFVRAATAGHDAPEDACDAGGVPEASE